MNLIVLIKFNGISIDKSHWPITIRFFSDIFYGWKKKMVLETRCLFVKRKKLMCYINKCVCVCERVLLKVPIGSFV